MQTSIKPCGHHLVVQPIELPEKSAGGIIVKLEGTSFAKLENAARMLGTVLAIGPQCWKAHAANLLTIGESDSAMLADWAKVGDVVMYSRHAGKYMFDPMDDKELKRELYLIHDEDVMAVLPQEENWKRSITDIVT